MNRRGFTAVEMVTVIGIMVLLVAMTVPAIGPGLQRGRVNDGANAIITAHSQAHLLALTQVDPNNSAKNQYFVEIDYETAGSRYVVKVGVVKIIAGSKVKQTLRTLKLHPGVSVYRKDIELTSPLTWNYQNRTGLLMPDDTSTTMTDIATFSDPTKELSVRQRGNASKVRANIALYGPGVAHAQDG